MRNQFNPNYFYISFLEIYQSEIAPQLESLDILLKSMEDEPLTISEASGALNISPQELKELMHTLGIREIDRGALLSIMKRASSPICKLYQREIDVGSPYVYTREEISYIYGLPLDDVSHACDELGMKEVTAYTLPELFGNVFQPSPIWAQST